MSKRSYIEVGPYSGKTDEDPLKLFAFMVRKRYGGTEKTEQYNRTLLETLISKGQIPRSSIVWHDDTIYRIYGFKINEKGSIEYDISSNHSPIKKTYVTSTPPIDMSAFKNAIIRSKNIAI